MTETIVDEILKVVHKYIPSMDKGYMSIHVLLLRRETDRITMENRPTIKIAYGKFPCINDMILGEYESLPITDDINKLYETQCLPDGYFYNFFKNNPNLMMYEVNYSVKL